MMKASVIIPAFHSQDFIADGIGSVFEQTYPDWEIVVAADDGQDYMPVLAKQGIATDRIRCVKTGGIATGVANTRNTALREAKGRVIVSLDADDLLHPVMLETMVPLALEHGAAYSNTGLVDFATGTPVGNCNRARPAGISSLEDTLTGNLHTFAGAVFDRQRLPELWWPDVIRWEDMLLFATCCDALDGMYYVPDCLYIYRLREGSICHRPETAQEFKEWAQRILEDLKNKHFYFTNPATVPILEAYFKSRMHIESRYMQALEAGECKDYRHFMQENLELFYQLDYSPL